MVQLVKIGNSQGVRIPRAFIKQAKLSGCELDLRLVENGLLISPKQRPRANWRAEIETLGIEPVDSEWLEADLSSDECEW